jgi:hypothetical protein
MYEDLDSIPSTGGKSKRIQSEIVLLRMGSDRLL